MPSISGSTHKLMGNNSIQLKCDYTESVSGEKNKISFSFKVWTKYWLSGTWRTVITVDGETLMNKSYSYNHGSTTSSGTTTVLSTSKTYTYEGKKSLDISMEIQNMDYYDVGDPSKIGVFDPYLSKTVTLKEIIVNKAPSKPTISITNANPRSDGVYYPENSFTVSLSGSTDPDGDNIKYIIDGEYKPPGGSWTKMPQILSSYSSESANVSITSYTRGTQFKVSGYTWDTKLSSPRSTEYTNIYRNRKPNKVTSVTPNGGVFPFDDLTVTWKEPTDPDGHAVDYKIWLSKDGAGYVRQPDVASGSFVIKTGTGNHGAKYRLKIVATDGITDADAYETPVFQKNQKPSTPRMIGPSSGYFEDAVKLTWNASTDPEGFPISKYNVYINDSYIGETNKTEYNWNVPKNDPEGKTYTVSVEAVDNYNAKSDRGIASGSFSKPKRPDDPVWEGPDEEFHVNFIYLEWENQTSNGTEVFYDLEVKVNGGSWESLGIEMRKNSYKFDISSDARGSSYEFRLKAINSFSMHSSWSESITFYKNKLPLKPEIVYPVSGGTVLGGDARICLRLKNEPDRQGQRIYINIKGSNGNYDKTFNNISNPSMFSTSSSQSYAKDIVFSCSGLEEDIYSITMYVNDGLEDSEKVYSSIFVWDPELSVSSNTLIKAEDMIEIRECIDIVRKSYGKEKYDFNNSIKEEITIKFSIIEEIRKSILEIRTLLNDFDSSTPSSKKRSTSWLSAKKNDLIISSIIQEIINMVKNP